MLERSAIEGLIPHSGRMCLLDRVDSWGQSSIACVSQSHHHIDNPLREGGRLNAAVLIEYGAQAAAVHARLSGAGIGGSRTALIGAVKALKLHCRHVDPTQDVLLVSARNVLHSADCAIYEIDVRANGELLVEARVVLVIPIVPD